MAAVLPAAFAFLSGLTAAGIAGAALELAGGRLLTFAEPFVSRRRIAMSLAAIVAAGPFMLGNDALDAWRGGRVSGAVLACAALASTTWIFATGVVVLELVLTVSGA